MLNKSHCIRFHQTLWQAHNQPTAGQIHLPDYMAYGWNQALATGFAHHIHIMGGCRDNLLHPTQGLALFRIDLQANNLKLEISPDRELDRGFHWNPQLPAD